jgi:hypothetical protein
VVPQTESNSKTKIDAVQQKAVDKKAVDNRKPQCTKATKRQEKVPHSFFTTLHHTHSFTGRKAHTETDQEQQLKAVHDHTVNSSLSVNKERTRRRSLSRMDTKNEIAIRIALISQRTTDTTLKDRQL